MAELKQETETKMETYIEELLMKEMSLLDVQTAVKKEFKGAIEGELGQSEYDGFQVPIARIRTIHAQLCAEKNSDFECAGLFED